MCVSKAWGSQQGMVGLQGQYFEEDRTSKRRILPWGQLLLNGWLSNQEAHSAHRKSYGVRGTKARTQGLLLVLVKPIFGVKIPKMSRVRNLRIRVNQKHRIYPRD